MLKYPGNIIRREDIYPKAVQVRSISLLAHPMVVYTCSRISLAQPTAVYTRSITLLVYPMAVYTISIALLASDCAPKIYFTASIPISCVHTLLAYTTILYPIKALSTIFPMVVHPRFISLLVYPMALYTNDITLRFMSLLVYPMAVYRIGVPNYPVPKALNCMFPMVVHQRSKSLLAYPAAMYTRSISLLAYPAVVNTSIDIGLVYKAVVYIRAVSMLVC